MTTQQERTGRLTRLRRAPTAVPRAGVRAVRRWQDFRVRQRELLDESNRLQSELWEQIHRTQEPVEGAVEGQRHGSTETRPGSIFSLSPFYVGFSGALGVFLAWLLVQNLTRMSSVLTVVVVAAFLTLALNPLVEWLVRHGASRAASVFLVFVGFIGVTSVAGLTLLPGVVSQAISLIEGAPRYVNDLASLPWVVAMDEDYQVTQRVTVEMDQLLADRTTWTALFGGVLGAAGWVAGSLVGVVTSAILTLYLLATLPVVKDAAYHLVPASRRPGVARLAEEIMRRVGGYALGQAAVATINAGCSWLMMMVLGVPYAGVLAVTVGFLGLIPMVGATLGAIIVALAALSVSPTTALVVIGYYVVYQQIENYWIVPRIMKRTVSVPGAVTVVAVLAGGTLLGVLGALIAIPVAAGLLLVYEEVLVPRQDAR